MTYELRFPPQAEEDLGQLTRADGQLAHRILTKLETFKKLILPTIDSLDGPRPVLPQSLV